MLNLTRFRSKLFPSSRTVLALVVLLAVALNIQPAAASSTVLYVLTGGALSQTAGTNAVSDTIPSAGGTNHDGTPTNPIIYTLSGVNGTYDNTLATAFNLYVDAGTAVGNGQQAQVQYDFTGDGTWDRTETYNYFATDPAVGWQLYTQASGLKSSSGTFTNLSNGKVRIQVWSAIGNAASTLRVSATSAQGQQSTLTIPFALGGGATPTNTSVGPTNTPTNTSVPPTNTPTSTPTTGCGTTNVAQGKPVIASSVENAGTPATNAVDGSATTRWSSAFSDPQWIQVDLGSTQSICRVRLNWEAAYAKSYQIQTSLDATTWTTIYSTTTGDGGIDDITGLNATGRYVRMYGTVRALPYGYSLWEFEIYIGSSGPTPTNTPVPPTNTPTPTNTTCVCPTNTPTNTSTPSNTPTNTPVQPTNTPTNTSQPGGDIVLSYAKPATASTIQNDANCTNCTADKAFDMLNYTRWATAWADPQWIYVDLSATATIHRVYLKWEAAYGKAYQIQTSPDANTWTTIYSTTTGDGGVDDLTGLNGTGRYVRMYATVRGTAYGYSLWDMDVYGTGGAPNPTPTPAPTPTPMNFNTLVWSDEFNAASLNTTNWAPEVGGGGFGNNEREYYTNGNNLIFTGAEMIIEARKENPANYQCWYGTCTYTSARLKSQGLREFTYGRMEARLQIPYSQGLWPAFWMLGNDIGTVGWPTSGEIDIMENIGKEPSTVHGTIHGPGYSGCCGIGGPYTLPSGQLHDAYHVYSIEWDSQSFKWFIDGTQYFSTTRSFVETKGPWVYSHPFFFLLNVAVGGAWPGDPDGTTVMPQQMKVDYVRVYQ